MHYGVSLALDHLCFSTKSFDFLFCTSTESVSLNCKLLSKFSISKNLYAVSWVLNDTCFDQCIY